MENSKLFSRRKFIQTSALAVGTVASASVFGSPAIVRSLGSKIGLINGVKIGVITYSFRTLPDQSAEATLGYIKDCNLTATELMGDPAETFAGKPKSPYDMREIWMAMRRRNDENLSDDEKKKLTEMQAVLDEYNQEVLNWRKTVSMDKFTELKKMYADGGVSIYAFKPNAFNANSHDAEIDYGFNAAKALGASHVTVEIPQDPEQSMRLGKFAKKHKMFMAYHGHEQQNPTAWDTALSQSDYNGINLDLGHWVAAGNPDPAEFIISKHSTIKSMHVKDRQNPEHGKANLPFGKGNTPIVEVLQLMRDKNYTFPATIELEYEIPEGSTEVKEIGKCVEYCEKALA